MDQSTTAIGELLQAALDTLRRRHDAIPATASDEERALAARRALDEFKQRLAELSKQTDRQLDELAEQLSPPAVG